MGTGIEFARTPQCTKIAYKLVLLGNQYWHEPEVQAVMDTLADLEVPDGVIVFLWIQQISMKKSTRRLKRLLRFMLTTNGANLPSYYNHNNSGLLT